MPERFDVALLESGLESEQALVRSPVRNRKEEISIAMETRTPTRPIKMDIFIDYT